MRRWAQHKPAPLSATHTLSFKFLQAVMRLLKRAGFDKPRLTLREHSISGTNGHFVFRQRIETPQNISEPSTIEWADLLAFEKEARNLGIVGKALSLHTRTVKSQCEDSPAAEPHSLLNKQYRYDAESGLQAVLKHYEQGLLADDSKLACTVLDPKYLRLVADLALAFEWQGVQVEFVLDATRARQRAPVVFKRFYHREAERPVGLQDMVIIMPLRD